MDNAIAKKSGESPSVQARGLMTDLNGADQKIMYMPGGVHTINCGLAGKAAVTVTLQVDREGASALNADLADENKRNAPQRALFDKDHEQKEAMAWPTELFWSDKPQPGIYASAEMSSLGKEYTEGKVVRAFSGSFYTDAELPKRSEVKAGATYEIKAGKRGSPQNPARIIGIEFPFAGTFTNNPAFREILPLWAKAGKEGSREGTEEKAGLRSQEAMQIRRALITTKEKT